MLINLFQTVRSAGVPCTLRELLDLLGALEKQLAYSNIDDFYYLSRAILVKDEKHYDKFDKAFDIYFKGIEKLEDIFQALIPEDWLRKAFEKELDPEELKRWQKMKKLITAKKIQFQGKKNMKSKDHLKINDFKIIQFIFLSIMFTFILRQSYVQKKMIDNLNYTQLRKELQKNIELTPKYVNSEKDVIDRYENLKMEKIKSIILNNSEKNKTNKRIYQKNQIILILNLFLVFLNLILIYLFLNQIFYRQTDPFILNLYNNRIFFRIYSSIFIFYIVSLFVYHKFFVE